MDLIFASANKNKIKEITALLSDRYRLYGLEEAGIMEEIPEPGATIKENSFLKASYVIDKLKSEGKEIAVFADDSGLEVEALNNAPGVYSARYAGIPKNDEANNKKLLEELTGKENRKAKFGTVITLIKDGQINYFEGEVRGVIAHSASGTNGFGYDPLFIPEGFERSFAEFTKEEKNKISHRGRAVQKLIAFLTS